MAKLKKTKTELKGQREALARFHRFLPTLELKKQQLQMELRHTEAELRVARDDLARLETGLRPWVRLFAAGRPLADHARLAEVRTATGNVAGVAVPVLEEIVFVETPVDYFATPAWFEDGVSALRGLTTLRARLLLLERQRALLAEELRITSQRVNLFEKVMIPRTEENIRVINIALGDAQTAAVARAKIAKAKTASLSSGATGG